MTRLPGLSDSLTPDAVQDQLDKINQRLGLNRSLEIVAYSKITVTWDGTTGQVASSNYDHNLGYAPSFMCFFDNGGNKQQLPFYEIAVGSVKSDLTCYTDNTKFQAIHHQYIAGLAGSIDVHFYLFREPATIS